MNLSLNSIAGRTLLIFVGVFLLILLPVNTFTYLRIKATLEESETRELRVEAERLMDQVKLDPIVIPLPRQGYSLMIQSRYPDHAEKLFASPDFPNLDEPYFSQDAVQFDTITIVHYRKESGPGELVLSLARSNELIRGRLGEFKTYLWLAHGLSIAIACVLVFLITAYTTQPIQRIIAVTKRISASRSMERVPVPKSSNETRALAETINSMLERLEVSIKQQTNFFASAAHELKTPLSVMKSELSQARDRADNPASREILVNCMQEVDRLNRIIHSFLLISQLRSQSLRVRRTPVAFDELLYAALKKVRMLAEEKKSTLRLTVDEHSSDFGVTADPDLMETVLINLLENAIRHAPSGCVVDIQVRKSGSEVQLRIINPVDEPVLEPEELVKEFTKVKSFTPGFGMGLWICDQVIRLHEGQLSLTTSAEGAFVAVVLIRE